MRLQPSLSDTKRRPNIWPQARGRNVDGRYVQIVEMTRTPESEAHSL